MTNFINYHQFEGYEDAISCTQKVEAGEQIEKDQWVFVHSDGKAYTYPEAHKDQIRREGQSQADEREAGQSDLRGGNAAGPG